jgi:peptide/nickel transport system permease protein
MWTFLARRALSLPPLLLVISVMTYVLLQLAPGDFYTRLEQDPKYSFDYVMSLRNSVGRVEPVSPERRASELREFTVADRRYGFNAEGKLLRDGREIDPQLEQSWLKHFEWPVGESRRWTVTDKGAVYREIHPAHGYLVWLGNVIPIGPRNEMAWYRVDQWRWKGTDLGQSWSKKAPVVDVMWTRLYNTLVLEIVALLIAWGLAIPLGVWSGVKPNSFVDHVCGVVAYVSISVPTVFLSLLALLFALSTKWFPVGNMHSDHYETFGAWQKFTDVVWHLTLPALVVGLTSIALYMRQMRGQMVETMSSDYVRTARAKGVPHRTVMFKHALRNAINPLVTLFGFSLAGLLAGSFLVEVVFNWPGLAQVTVNAVFEKDEPLVMASVLFATFVLVLGNLVADVLLAIVDPKIRLA